MQFLIVFTVALQTELSAITKKRNHEYPGPPCQSSSLHIAWLLF